MVFVLLNTTLVNTPKESNPNPKMSCSSIPAGKLNAVIKRDDMNANQKLSPTFDTDAVGVRPATEPGPE